jgi:2,4-dienoyl-CoA reductase-like NADH-dependent reductase (Old Yellow Enzyme family)/thioredoxin reductase
MQRFERIFEPINVGPLHLKNRVMMAPCVTFFAEDGFVSDRVVDFYHERAKGGVSLIIVEATYPCFSGRPRRLFLFDDKFIPGLTKLVEAIHQGGARAAIQLNPSAGKADEKEPVYVSLPKKSPVGARELSESEIKRIIEEFGEGCRRACEANFDAIQIHGGSGYLVYQFLSPLTNRRKDLYGGTLENRARFGLGLVSEARKRVGERRAILFRICSDDHMEGGFRLSEAQHFAALLERAGVDSVDVTTGATETSEYLRPGMQFPKGNNLQHAKMIRSIVTIPVSVAGSINDPFIAEEILKKGEVDFIAMGRPLIADPFFVVKLADGRVSDINQCILCNQGCTEYPLIKKTALMCTVNPRVGREGDSPLSRVKRSRRILIIGGGPSGMYAAITAAKRGHEVTVVERKGSLGGNLSAASGVFFKKEIEILKKYLIREVERLPVNTEMGREADTPLIDEFQPEVLILATGAVAAMPVIPGIDGMNVRNVADVLSGRCNTGEKIIVVGGGMMGCEAAVFLKGQGKDVSLVTPHGLDKLALGMEFRLRRWFVLNLWPRMGIPLYPHAKVEAITNEGVIVKEQEWGGRFRLLGGDTVVFALGLRADNRLNLLLGKGVAQKIYRIGDCVRPRSILEAIHEGYRVGIDI